MSKMKNEYAVGCIASEERFFGVYETADLVPTLGVNPFDAQEWTETNKPRMIQMREKIEEKGMPAAYFYPIIAVIKSRIREKGFVKIVDIGGGQGENYINIVRCLGMAGIEYHVVEQEKNCAAGRMLQLPGNICFHENTECGSSSLNDEAHKLLREADICLVIGTLQYFPMYSALLKEIAETGVEYVYITRTLINSAVATFYTRQYIASSLGDYKDIILGDIPLAIINHHELNQCMCELGYDICLDLFQMDYSKYFRNFSEPYNKVKYRDILYRVRK